MEAVMSDVEDEDSTLPNSELPVWLDLIVQAIEQPPSDDRTSCPVWPTVWDS